MAGHSGACRGAMAVFGLLFLLVGLLGVLGQTGHVAEVSLTMLFAEVVLLAGLFKLLKGVFGGGCSSCSGGK